jgi:hypothetical protein
MGGLVNFVTCTQSPHPEPESLGFLVVSFRLSKCLGDVARTMAAASSDEKTALPKPARELGTLYLEQVEALSACSVPASGVSGR